MNILRGKTAIVTGGAGGIGSAIARNLIDAGARVAIADVDVVRARDVAADLGQASALPVRLDVTRVESWTEAREEIERTLGPVDILINNAGVAFTAALDTIAIEAWRWVYEVNVLGSLHGLSTFLPAMKQRNSGHVVFMSSITAFHPFAQQGAYTSSKAALLNIATVLKRELVGTSIGVTAVCPGIVATDLRQNAVRARPAELQSVAGEESKLSTKLGMEPSFVGKAVVDATRDDRFYVFTHADYAASIASERDLILAAMTQSADPNYREPEVLLEPLPR